MPFLLLYTEGPPVVSSTWHLGPPLVSFLSLPLTLSFSLILSGATQYNIECSGESVCTIRTTTTATRNTFQALSYSNMAIKGFSRQPSPYPRPIFHAIRITQLISSIIVLSILSYFIWWLKHDHYYVPWTFILVHLLLRRSRLGPTDYLPAFKRFFLHNGIDIRNCLLLLYANIKTKTELLYQFISLCSVDSRIHPSELVS